MQLAKVTGTVVATRKNEKLEGAKLLLVTPIDGHGRTQGAPLLPACHFIKSHRH